MVTIEDRKGVFDSISPLMERIVKIKDEYLERNKENILFGYCEFPYGNFYAKRIGDGLIPIYKLVRYDVTSESIGIYVRMRQISPDDDIVNSTIPLDVEEIPDYVNILLNSDIEELSWRLPFNSKDIEGSLDALAEYIKREIEKKNRYDKE